MSKSTAVETSITTGIGAPVAIPGQVAKITALVAESAARAAVSVLLGAERGAVGSGDIDGLGFVVVAGGDGELNAIAFEEGAETVGSDGRVVNEEVFSAVVGLDEAESFGVVEPLDDAGEPLLRHWESRTNPRKQNILKREERKRRTKRV